jgi:predicted rRNA methylase
MPPRKIPYSTAASEFVYGTNAVEAALRCSRRQQYVLYVYQGQDEDLSPEKSTLRKLALSKGIKVKMAFAEWVDVLDEMSQDRPHNGVVLEASPLPQLPVTGFRAVPSIEDTHFRVDMAPQTREELAVNGSDNRIPILSQHRQRYPVTLLLDGIVDTGNLGAIVRSAYFLGVDAIVFAGRNSAPLAPVAIKASAGAAENMTILTVRDEVAFIKQSKANGWRFYAADAPGVGSTLLDPQAPADGSSGPNPSHLSQAPSVIMMGSEASGLAPHIKSHADSIVSIPGSRISSTLGVNSDPARVDSLNVSVAAALLMEIFLRVPVAVSGVPSKRGR